jgi:homoserine O-acetyltransferase
MTYYKEHKKITIDEVFITESGLSLPSIDIAYSLFSQDGNIHNGKPIVFVCHAFSGNTEVDVWWNGLFEGNVIFNYNDFNIIVPNILGSCYGSTGPLSINPSTGLPYYDTFPEITIRDLVKAHILLADYLGVGLIDYLIGGSIGGMQALEWSILQPDRILNQIVIAAPAKSSSYVKALNETQRMAIQADSTIKLLHPDGGKEGLRAARSIAHISYRTPKAYIQTQTDLFEDDFVQLTNSAKSYQNYQADKFVDRFNAYSYLTLTKLMDSHNVGRYRGGIENALTNIQAKTLLIAIQEDLLYTIDEIRYYAQFIENVDFVEISSIYGHDGFIKETNLLSEIITEKLLSTHKKINKN